MKIRYSAQARGHLDAVHAFIAEHDRGAADRVLRSIRRSVERLRVFPNAGREGVVEGTRELVASNLPYIVVYEHHPQEVRVLAVFHGARAR